MGAALEIVIFVVVALAVVVGLVGAIVARESPYEQIGRGGLSFEHPGRAPRAVPSAGPHSEQAQELRQMLQARADRRIRRGEAPLDVEAELARRLAAGPWGPIDAGAREEIRELAIARNARRERRGQPPLDVESEVARGLRELHA